MFLAFIIARDKRYNEKILPPGAKWYVGEILPPGTKWYNEKMLPPGA
jgi:hypothetical protein